MLTLKKQPVWISRFTGAWFVLLVTLVTVAIWGFGAVPAQAAAPSALDIMKKNDEARRLSSAISHAKMETGGPGVTTRSKEFTWWRKLTSDNIHSNTLTRFVFPPDVKNEGILFLENNGEMDVQIYLPNFKKIRRVETGQQSSSFMGSELSYSDIAPPHVDDFTYKMIKEENCPGDEKIKCWVIESTPARDSVRDRTGVGSATSWIRQDNYMAAKIDSDDVNKAHWKTLEASDIKEVDTNKHKWMALHMKMTTAKTGHYTDLHFENVKVDSAIPDSTFTPQNLSRD